MFDVVQQRKIDICQKKPGHGTEHIVIYIMKSVLQPRRIDRLLNTVCVKKIQFVSRKCRKFLKIIFGTSSADIFTSNGTEWPIFVLMCC